MFDKEDLYKYEEIDFNLPDYLARSNVQEINSQVGILALPSPNWRGTDDCVYLPETFNFVKWVKSNRNFDTQINVAETEKTKVAQLYSHDFWLPVVYLFSDVSLQVYLGMVSSYLYDLIKGSLQNDDHKVDIEVYVEDKKKGRTRKFTYHGSYKGFEKIAKKINVNDLLDGE